MKKILGTLYVLLIVVLAIATFVEKRVGTAAVSDIIYGSWWFVSLWAVGTACGILYFCKQHVRSVVTVGLHLSFVLILVGALLTHCLAERGMVHLRKGVETRVYTDGQGKTKPLPFGLRLVGFTLSKHDGTDAVQDYTSSLDIVQDRATKRQALSMNEVCYVGTARLLQNGYDNDMRGSYLSLNADPYGIGVTYLGYALLFVTLGLLLFQQKGTFRRALRGLSSGKMLFVAGFLMFGGTVNAQSVLSRATADDFGRLCMVYHDRVCPVQTFAIDFTKKLSGKPSYRDFTPEQVLTGFMIWGDQWMHQPILHVSSSAVRDTFRLPEMVAPADLFTENGYLLGPYVSMQHDDAFHQAVQDLDDKLMLIMQLRQYNLFRLFPFTHRDGQTTWYSPLSDMPRDVSAPQQQYVRDILPMMADYARAHQEGTVREIISRLSAYQHRYGGRSLPTPTQLKAERLYNKVPFVTILFGCNLLLGLLSFLVFFRRRWHPWCVLFMILSLLTLTLVLVMRWIIERRVPMSNGYETTLVMAWFVMVATLLLSRRSQIVLSFGFLMSGFLLLVSHINQMNPAITNRMPVLNSPLLSVHVSIIMMAYALLSLTFIIAVAYLVLSRWSNMPRMTALCHQLDLLSVVFLYPGMVTLGVGMFMGAIWANVSWGSYWSWDPKETWALITLMVYAIPMHRQSLPLLRRPLYYHLFLALAFLCIAMTYFGVNYFLGGMHSYA